MMNETKQMSRPRGYAGLFRDGGFQAFLWTQFLGAFNDNVYKMIVSILAVEIAANAALGAHYLGLANAVFMIPFFLFAGHSGQLADRFSKTRVLQLTKAFEIVVMLTGIGALLSHRIEPLLVVLFMLAMQANFFSPAKYGILPEMVGEAQLARANGLLELTTYAAIVLGTSFGPFLFEHWKDSPMTMGLTLLGIAVAGSLASIKITHVPASGSSEPFHWNPFAEIWTGAVRLRQNRGLWLTVLGISYVWFLGDLFQMAILLMSQETLHVTAGAIGPLMCALAVGIGAGSIAAGRLSGDHVELGLVPLGSALMGVCCAALGMTTSYPWALAWLAAFGFSGGLFVVPLNAYLQDRADATEKGRVLATNNVVNTLAMILATPVLWLLHNQLHWKASEMILALGVLTVGATAYVLWLLPDISLRFVLWCGVHTMFRVRIVGGERVPRSGGALLVSSHVSFADALLVGCTTNRMIRFLMWQPYFEIGLLRPFLHLLQAIPLPTGAPKQSIRALRNAKQELESGNLVCIFPEGGITRTGHLQPFQRGFERIVDGLDVPVIPVYLEGLWGHPLSMKGGGLFRSWAWPLRREVIIYIGEPVSGTISPAELHLRVMALSSRAADLRKKDRDTLPRRFVATARKNWFAPAVADSMGKNLTFGKTLSAAVLLRRWLDAERAGEEFIGLLLPSSVGGTVANLGVTLAGRTAVNLNFTTGEESMRSAVNRCGTRTVLTARAFLEKAGLPATEGMVFLEDLTAKWGRVAKVRAVLAARFAPASWLAGRAHPDSIAAVIFSSGSTGEPKGIQLTHWNLISNIEAVAQVYGVDSRDCMLGVLPFFHAFGYTYTLWFPLIRGFRSVLHANPMDAKTIGELAAGHRATLLLSTPTFCLSYLRKCTREQFSTLRFVLVGAEKLRAPLAEAFYEKFGVMPLEGYGCTEMGPVVAVNALDIPGCRPPQIGNRPGSVGRPIPGVAVRIVDPGTMEPLPAGSEGLLLVSGPSRMAGYLGDPARTREVLHDGFYVTGDIARLDEDGFLHIVDRLSRFSKIAGEMVPHVKVEEALSPVLNHTPCVVVGIPDDHRGERLAVLYTREDATPTQLVESLRATELPPLWIPKRENIYRVEAIPTLGTGKTDLRRARTIALERTENTAA